MLQRQSTVCAIVIGSLLFLFALTGGGHSADIQSPSHEPGLMRLSASLAAKRAGTILVVGSSSTVGLGASSPVKTYVAQLQLNLQRAFPGVNLRVVARGVSGEMALGAAARMKREVAATKPDLVLRQVGTNDALGHYALDRFEGCLQRTLAWLKDQGVDIILLNPQYGEALIKTRTMKRSLARSQGCQRKRACSSLTGLAPCACGRGTAVT